MGEKGVAVPLELRILLVFGAIFLLVYVFKKVRSTPVQVTDTIFWFVSAIALLILAIFPSIVFACANVLGVQSPANLVFVIIIAALILRVFLSSMEIAVLKNRVNALSQEMALKEKAIKDDKALSGECDSTDE